MCVRCVSTQKKTLEKTHLYFAPNVLLCKCKINLKLTQHFESHTVIVTLGDNRPVQGERYFPYLFGGFEIQDRKKAHQIGKHSEPAENICEAVAVMQSNGTDTVCIISLSVYVYVFLVGFLSCADCSNRLGFCVLSIKIQIRRRICWFDFCITCDTAGSI